MTAFQAEGCGIARRAMSMKSALRDWLSVSYVTQYPVPPIFSFPLEGKSREAGKGVRGRASIGCSIAVLAANRRPPPSEAVHSEHILHYANWICKGASATRKSSESVTAVYEGALATRKI